jgi:integrase
MRHTFATMMLSEGEDPGWVQNMMGHSSLQMIFTRYFAWIPKTTRNDGSAFMSQVVETEKQGRATDRKKKSCKVIFLFGKK